MLDFIKQHFAKTSPPSRTHIVAPKAPGLNIERATGGAFRKGMWVVVLDKVCILTDLDVHGTALVAVTNSDGENIPAIVEGHLSIERIQLPVSQLRMARISEIPAKRISGVPLEALEAMGYSQ